MRRRHDIPPARSDNGPPRDEGSLQPVELRWIVLFWTGMALLTAANRMLGPRVPGFDPPSFGAAVGFALVQSYLWAALTPAIFHLAWAAADRRRRIGGALLLAVIGLVLAVAMDVVDDLLRLQVFHIPRPGYTQFEWLRGVSHFWFLNDLITFLAVLAAGFARAYFLRYRLRQEEAARLQAQTARLSAQLAEARLSALRSQLDPHFLFNTLHAISALVERDPAGVRRMIARLSELLRHNLEGAGEQEVPLEQELELVERYLEIMRIRFQGRLHVHTQADPAVLDALVPNLILQPLVENAIKHGMSEGNGAGRIRIDARREGERVILRVRDDGPAALAGLGAGNDGVGLRNTRARLTQLYGDDHALTLTASSGGVVAEVALPYHTRADLRLAAAPTG